MTSTDWVLLAVALTVLFWAVGAYNRLVRLRAEVSRAFAALDAHLVRMLVWVQSCLPESLDEEAPADGAPDAHAQSWRRLAAASEQFASALAHARARPLEPATAASVLTAYDVLLAAWQGAATPADDAQAHPFSERRQARHARLTHQLLPLVAAFNQAVRAYNHGVQGFPALLIAWLFRFRPAAPLVGVGNSGARLG